jgi:hypothetical protein
MPTNDSDMPDARMRDARSGMERASGSRRPAVSTIEHRNKSLDGEMLDLYAAILIAVPVALFLKSLWL